jgi:capsular exopolysaccharide synthesis family protein
VWLRPKGAPASVKQSAAPTRSASGRYDSRAAEQYRLLSANLQFASAGRPLQAVLVTSCGTRDGKTTTAANLAIVLAQTGKEVVLVDADLYAPSLHDQFGVDNGRGLTSLLREEYVVPVSVLVQTSVEGLRLLPTGPVPPNPGELLASQRMRDQLGRLRALADVVIIDSPPLLEAGDLAVLASVVDGVLLVVDAQRTRGPDAAHALATLRNAGALVLGAVLNRVPRDTAGYYHANDYTREFPGPAQHPVVGRPRRPPGSS